MHTPRSLLVLSTALALTAAGCGFSVETGSAESSGSGALPAAGACLEGATECDDTGGDMGAPPPDGGGMPVADGDEPVSHDVDADGPGRPEPTEVEPVAGLEDVHPVAWETVDVDPDDQSRVTVQWTSGVAPCDAFAGLEAEFTQDAVTLTVLEGTVPSDEPQACIEIAQAKQATVELDEEIGPRSIVDGA